MSLLPPSIPGVSLRNGGYLAGITPYPDVTPFTIRSGATYQGVLEGIREWLEFTLIPYLEQNSWDTVKEQLVAAVDAALAAQKAQVNAAIAQAIQDFAQAHVDVTDPVILAVITNAQTQVAQWLRANYVNTEEFAPIQKFYAPRPSGGDDTQMLTDLINNACNTIGEVILDYGTYNVTQIVVNANYMQPIVRGRGKGRTTLQGLPGTAGKSIIKLNGGSGAVSGGGIYDMTIHGWDFNTNDGVELSGCGGVKVANCDIVGVQTAVTFHNERPNDFTEFCVVENTSVNTSHRFINYKVSNNVESFHGSGALGNNVFGFKDDFIGPAIQTQGIALPYNAPMEVTVFFTAPGQWLYDYANPTAGRHASHWGTIRAENSSALGDSAQLGRGNGGRVLFLGGVSILGSGTVTLGNIYLVKKISYEGGSVVAEYHPVSHRAKLKNTPTQFCAGVLSAGESGILAVHLVGGNYDKNYVFLAYQSPYADTGVLTQLVENSNIDGAGIGEATFTWGGYGLFVADPQFTNATVGHVTLTPLGGGIANFRLDQTSNL